MPYLHLYPLGRNALGVVTDDESGDLKRVDVTTRGFIIPMSAFHPSRPWLGATVYDRIIVHEQ
jgi:hypothetical protein